jgi:CHAD domain-containing protein
LKRHLPAAVAGDDHGVHQARVATRRLREAMPVLAGGLKKSKAGKARKKIRRLTGALGAVRETDVTLQILAELAQGEKLPRTAIEEVRAHVMAERDRRRTVMLERLERVNIDKLGRRLSTVAEALQRTDSEAWRDVLSSRLLKRSRRLAEAVGEAGQMYAPERLHEVRIAAKKLRYALELAADSKIDGAAALLRPMKRVQDLLGRLHDLQVLQSHVAEVQAGPGASRPGMHAALEAVARQLEDECRHLHGRYLMTVSSLGELCGRVAGDVVPQLQAPPVRRALKMSLARKPARAAGGGRR